jgi:hypothetical protein
LQPVEIVEHYPAHRSILLGWKAGRKLDLVAASLESLKRHLQPQRRYEAVVANSTHKANDEAFLADQPPDLREQIREWLDDRGFEKLTGPQQHRGKQP